MPFPPWPQIPSPVTWVEGGYADAAVLRSDVLNALLLLTQPPVFTGAQTGAPVSFTALASNSTFTAPGTAYSPSQPVVFTGSALPGGITAGTVYYVVNPNGDQFQVSATAGGAAAGLSSSGSGTVQQTQQVPSGVWTQVSLDTGVTDAWGGHLATTNPPYYYGMLPGWYLAEFTVPLSYTGGAGSVSAGVTAQEGTGPQTTYGGGRGPASGVAGSYAQPSAVKLLALSVTGAYGAVGGNYAAGAVYQDSGSALTPLATATRFAQLQLEWVAALTGPAAVPVPDNDPWPAPPLPVTAAFVNKNIRDTIGFLAYRPVMEASYAAGTFTLPAAASLPAVGVTVPLDTVYADNRSAFTTATSTWTAKAPGVYDFYGQVPVTSASTSTAVAAGLTVTSANYAGGAQVTIWGAPQKALTSGTSCATVRRRLRLNYGDTVLLAGFQADSGSNPATIPAGVWQARLISVWRAA